MSHSRDNVSPREVFHSAHAHLGLHGAPATLSSSASVGLDFAHLLQASHSSLQLHQ